MSSQVKNQAARDYYYSQIAPDEQGRNYQSLYMGQQLEKGSKLRDQLGEEKVQDYITRLANWTPKFSNDVLLDSLMEELIEINTGEAKEYLQSVFVAKRRDKYANASAQWKTAESDGNVVLFNVGLSDVAYQYSILFDHFKRLPTKIRERDYAATNRIRVLMSRMLMAHQRWDREFNFIQLTLDDMLDHEHVDPAGRASDVAALTDRFILCHEIAHHMHGHTLLAVRNLGRFHPATALRPEQWPLVEGARRDEIEADLTAIGLMLGTPGQTVKDLRTSTVLGTLLTMTLFGQLEKDVNAEGEEHPSVRTRYLNVVRCLSQIECEHFSTILEDVTNFQKFLYRDHRRGLAECRDEVTQLLNQSDTRTT